MKHTAKHIASTNKNKKSNKNKRNMSKQSRRINRR
jgi:hypothetical protein